MSNNDFERMSKLKQLIDRLGPDSMELYHTSAEANRAVNFIARGGDPLQVIGLLVRENKELQKRLVELTALQGAHTITSRKP